VEQSLALHRRHVESIQEWPIAFRRGTVTHQQNVVAGLQLTGDGAEKVSDL
jgi:hypothetical protein